MSRVFMKGCEAIAEAAVRAGCRFFAGYPITPQNEIPEYLFRVSQKLRLSIWFMELHQQVYVP